MNKYIIYLLIVMIFISPQVNAKNLTNINTEQWVEKHFSKGIIPPFSFVYDGISSNDFITKWDFQAEKKYNVSQKNKEYIYTYKDINTGIMVKCFVMLYDDYPAVDWVLRFYNISNHNSRIIEKANVLDQKFNYSQKGDFVYNHSLGSSAAKTDFMPITEVMETSKDYYLSPLEGRSSGRHVFPFFNVECPGNQGILFSVGWTGKWFASLKKQDEKTLSIISGMEQIRLYLQPQEEIRTPRICLLFWQGEEFMTGNNLFRRFVLAHHSRMIDGKFAELPMAVGLGYGGPYPCNEYNCLNESFAIALAERYTQFDMHPEVMWVDAGWYKGCGEWFAYVGNWEVEKNRFPHGLMPVSDAIHKAGAKFLLWFEPERVRENTDLSLQHPEWVIKINGSPNYLFNLGDEKARLWLTDYISTLIKNEGVDYYRQDFNMDPFPYWKANDQPDRTGISEIRHIEGLYAYWDSLLVRFPNLIIDNCASGGRRLDFETISRSSPLWRTDYQYGEPDGYQCHTFGLNYYLPLHGTGHYAFDDYSFRSSMSTAVVFNWDINNSTNSVPEMQKYMNEFKRLRPYYYGDYYPLTGVNNITGDNVWLAYQLNRPENNDGIVLAFRREKANDETITVQLHGLEKDAYYELYYEDYGIKTVMKGEEIISGISITAPNKRSSVLISYKKNRSR